MTVREIKEALRGIPDDAKVVIVREYPSADAERVDVWDFHFCLLSPSCAHPVIIQTSEFAGIVDARLVDYGVVWFGAKRTNGCRDLLVDYECDDEDGGGRIVKTRKAGA